MNRRIKLLVAALFGAFSLALTTTPAVAIPTVPPPEEPHILVWNYMRWSGGNVIVGQRLDGCGLYHRWGSTDGRLVLTSTPCTGVEVPNNPNPIWPIGPAPTPCPSWALCTPLPPADPFPDDPNI
jgi:hypothetical protein